MTDARPYRVDITVDGHRESIGCSPPPRRADVRPRRLRLATKREVEVVRKRAAADELGREQRRVDEAARQRAGVGRGGARAGAARAEHAAQMAAVEAARANKEKARAAADERRQARQAAAARVRPARGAARGASSCSGTGAPRRVGRAPEAAAR